MTDWWTPADGAAAVERALASETAIRESERRTIGWLRDKRWIAGKRLSDIVRRCREIHSQSVERTRALKQEYGECT